MVFTKACSSHTFDLKIIYTVRKRVMMKTKRLVTCCTAFNSMFLWIIVGANKCWRFGFRNPRMHIYEGGNCGFDPSGVCATERRRPHFIITLHCTHGESANSTLAPRTPISRTIGVERLNGRTVQAALMGGFMAAPLM